MGYSNSPLATYTKISPNKSSPRNAHLDTITIHCVVGQWTAKQICDYFNNSSRNASCNYGVGKDGSIGLCVEEKDRSWCTSNRSNDHRAITIETASDTTHPYAVTDAALNALIDLCTDICKRNGRKRLLWFGDKDTTLNYTPKDDEMVMTVHRWFANKACPGDYLYSRHAYIAAEVTKRLEDGSTSGGSTGDTTSPSAYASYIWNYFMGKNGNEYGVAGLMGNLHAESNLRPNNLQNSYETSLNFTDATYTAAVDNGSYSKDSFVNDKAGYGLAQWTYSTRKKGLYEMFKSGGYSSIGGIDLACDYLWEELQKDFPKVLNALKSATSIRAASDVVLHDFESPADQSTSVEEKRAEYAQYYYNKFATGSGNPDVPNDDHSGVYFRKLSTFLLLAVGSE